MFVLMACQFVPIILSVLLMVWEKVPEGHSRAFLVEQLIATMFFLLSALILKFGNYQKDEDSF